MTILRGLLARLPPSLPDTTPTEALPPALVVGGQIYLASQGPHPVSVTRGALDVPLNATPRQTARGRTWASGSGKPQPVKLKLTFFVQGTDAGDVGRRAARWHALSLAAEEYGEGASALTVLRVLSQQEPFGEGNGRTWTVEYLLADPLWRLDDSDPKPSPLPITGVLGNYPLGMLHAVAEGPGYYEVEPLGGVTVSDAPDLTYAHPGVSFTYTSLIEVADDEPQP